MTKPTTLMATLSPAILALALSLACPPASSALPRETTGPTCTCYCDSPGGAKEMTYTNAPTSCSGLEGKTCNYEGSDHIIRTGTLRGCSTASTGTGTSRMSRPPPVSGARSRAP